MINTIMSRLLAGKSVLAAEIGVNYYDIAKQRGISNMEAAKLMIREAVTAGIHAVKFQSYKAETLAAKDSPSYWDLKENPVTSQRELFAGFDSFGKDEYYELARYCESVGIEFFSTAFDYCAADYLESLMNVYKISSSDLSNLPFIRYQAAKGKPVMLSVGASNEDEIERAVATIRKVNSEPLILLHCVLEYPTPLAHANLLKIRELKKKFPDAIIGYSDHTKPLPDAAVTNAACLLGAQLIEKHYTLDKTLPGNDHYHGMDPEDARTILSGLDKVNLLMGSGELKCLDSELVSRRNARRSLVLLRPVVKGEFLTDGIVTAKRPGTGISPARLSEFIGRRFARDIDGDTILKESDFDAER